MSIHYQRYTWLRCLFEAPSTVNADFPLGRRRELVRFDDETLYLHYAASLRTNDLGAHSSVQSNTAPRFGGLAAYAGLDIGPFSSSRVDGSKMHFSEAFLICGVQRSLSGRQGVCTTDHQPLYQSQQWSPSKSETADQKQINSLARLTHRTARQCCASGWSTQLRKDGIHTLPVLRSLMRKGRRFGKDSFERAAGYLSRMRGKSQRLLHGSMRTPCGALPQATSVC
ncbi:glutamate--cysteine ligase [Burkholderia cepacia]|uniref:glutamate--cysteine ligase n=1 Tax=Burkholderia cepacia TaxID=292 RepID=UPI001CF1C930|nr:glutamate--cysteine ligase [Burkholderia cepacia]